MTSQRKQTLAWRETGWPVIRALGGHRTKLALGSHRAGQVERRGSPRMTFQRDKLETETGLVKASP